MDERILRAFNAYLTASLPCQSEYLTEFYEAVTYALTCGGKRVRPMLFLSVPVAYGFDARSLFPVAAALEYVHTYSLVHDDLPAMDNDDFRRGLPTLHKRYNDATAILAGDALLTEAFRLVSRSDALSAETRLELITILSEASGIRGMVGGQFMDMRERPVAYNVTELSEIHRLKTGRLFSAAVEMGLVIAAPAEAEKQRWLSLIDEFGRFFQLRDDLMDVKAGAAALGKKPGGDAEKNKFTYPALLGEEATEELLEKSYLKMTQVLSQINVDTLYVSSMITNLYAAYNAGKSA